MKADLHEYLIALKVMGGRLHNFWKSPINTIF